MATTWPINDGRSRRDMTLVFDAGYELAQVASHEIDAPRIHDGRPAVRPARCLLAEIIPRIAARDTSAPRESSPRAMPGSKRSSIALAQGENHNELGFSAE